MQDPGKLQTLSEYKKELEDLLKFNASTFIEAAERMSSFANQVNKTFGQGRQRVTELMTAITDSVPNVNRLGGEISDVAETIEKVATASRRNVIASSKDVEKLFAASKVLGTDAQVLSDAFLDIGVGIERIPEQLEKSMEYVRSIGGNSKQVFESVQRNMDQMNRYQFEGGVVGLTKMAAQASMLRFNMNETFKLADRVLDPEGAIEVASAFQRLGVAAGNLADPFQLMNQSINDPSGLQNSLADVAKQFTYFDEKTKTFKINPQGVMTLREMEKQTGVSAAEMSKLGLAAAELDQRLSAVNQAGLKIATEEDKQYLANIAKMGEGGEYEVKITDEEGKQQTKKLSEVTQEEFDKLIKEQKDGPKTLEDTARAQLTNSEIIKNDLSAIRNKVLGGVVSAGQITKGMETARGAIEKYSGEFSKIGETKDVRDVTESFVSNLKQLAKDLQDPNKKTVDAFSSFLEKFDAQLQGVKTGITSGVKDAITSAGEKSSTTTTQGQKAARAGDKLYGLAEGRGASTENQPLTTTVSPQAQSKKVSEAAQSQSYGTTKTSDVNVGGKITVDLVLPDNFSQLNSEQQQKILDNIFNSQQFQQMIANVAAPKNPTKQPVGYGYNR